MHFPKRKENLNFYGKKRRQIDKFRSLIIGLAQGMRMNLLKRLQISSILTLRVGINYQD